MVDENERQKEELKQKQEKELEELTSRLEDVEINEEVQVELKRDKARKKREKKLQKEAAATRAFEQAEKEASTDGSSLRNIELAKLDKKLCHFHLMVKEVAADGHCLFRALADQLKCLHDSKRRAFPAIAESKAPHMLLRSLCGNHILDQQDTFLPFFDFDEMAEQSVEAYVTKLKTTSVWGGQMELRALSNVLNVPIHVFVADGEDIEFVPVVTAATDAGDNKLNDSLNITFHKHYLTAGEHYNSTRPSSGGKRLN